MTLKTYIDSSEIEANIVGMSRSNLKVIENTYGIMVESHGGAIITNAKDELIISKLEKIFSLLISVAKEKNKITPRDVVYLINLIENNEEENYLKLFTNKKAVSYTYNNKPIYPKTLKQIEFIELLDKKDIIFSLGAAGTGKTFLSVAYAVWQLKKGSISKIILTRPAVEAGESLGYLPGDLKEKVDPYLRPLYDALYDTLGYEQTETLIEKQIIEIAPLAYMRGRTLENSFIILDEAQNATKEQLKMFLTRLGFNSKMVITGDPSQIDLNEKLSGLETSANLLKNIQEVGIIRFRSVDVVRHPLVGKIIEAFEGKVN